MRLLLSGLIAAGLAICRPASAACIGPADQAALDIAGLRTQLMVTALTCGAQARYNAFILRYKPEMAAQERVADNYFSHSYGRSGQTRHDEYMTQLANGKSKAGLSQGNRFCDYNVGMFDEVMALKSGRELQEYAAGRSTAAPATFTNCATLPEPPRARSPSSRSSPARRHR
jgi:hypothetical protein